jgi:hypothetical protein
VLKIILNSKVCPICFHRFSSKDVRKSPMVDSRASLKKPMGPALIGTSYIKSKKSINRYGRSITVNNTCRVNSSFELEYTYKLILTCNNCKFYNRILKLE